MSGRPPSDWDETRVSADLPNLGIDVRHRRAWNGNAEQIQVTLTAPLAGTVIGPKASPFGVTGTIDERSLKLFTLNLGEGPPPGGRWTSVCRRPRRHRPRRPRSPSGLATRTRS